MMSHRVGNRTEGDALDDALATTNSSVWNNVPKLNNRSVSRESNSSRSLLSRIGANTLGAERQSQSAQEKRRKNYKHTHITSMNKETNNQRRIAAAQILFEPIDVSKVHSHHDNRSQNQQRVSKSNHSTDQSTKSSRRELPARSRLQERKRTTMPNSYHEASDVVSQVISSDITVPANKQSSIVESENLFGHEHGLKYPSKTAPASVKVTQTEPSTVTQTAHGNIQEQNTSMHMNISDDDEKEEDLSHEEKERRRRVRQGLAVIHELDAQLEAQEQKVLDAKQSRDLVAQELQQHEQEHKERIQLERKALYEKLGFSAPTVRRMLHTDKQAQANEAFGQALIDSSIDVKPSKPHTSSTDTLSMNSRKTTSEQVSSNVSETLTPNNDLLQYAKGNPTLRRSQNPSDTHSFLQSTKPIETFNNSAATKSKRKWKLPQQQSDSAHTTTLKSTSETASDVLEQDIWKTTSNSFLNSQNQNSLADTDLQTSNMSDTHYTTASMHDSVDTFDDMENVFSSTNDFVKRNKSLAIRGGTGKHRLTSEEEAKLEAWLEEETDTSSDGDVSEEEIDSSVIDDHFDDTIQSTTQTKTSMESIDGRKHHQTDSDKTSELCHSPSEDNTNSNNQMFNVEGSLLDKNASIPIVSKENTSEKASMHTSVHPFCTIQHSSTDIGSIDERSTQQSFQTTTLQDKGSHICSKSHKKRRRGNAYRIRGKIKKQSDMVDLKLQQMIQEGTASDATSSLYSTGPSRQLRLLPFFVTSLEQEDEFEQDIWESSMSARSYPSHTRNTKLGMYKTDPYAHNLSVIAEDKEDGDEDKEEEKEEEKEESKQMDQVEVTHELTSLNQSNYVKQESQTDLDIIPAAKLAREYVFSTDSEPLPHARPSSALSVATQATHHSSASNRLQKRHNTKSDSASVISSASLWSEARAARARASDPVIAEQRRKRFEKRRTQRLQLIDQALNSLSSAPLESVLEFLPDEYDEKESLHQMDRPPSSQLSVNNSVHEYLQARSKVRSMQSFKNHQLKQSTVGSQRTSTASKMSFDELVSVATTRRPVTRRDIQIETANARAVVKDIEPHRAHLEELYSSLRKDPLYTQLVSQVNLSPRSSDTSDQQTSAHTSTALVTDQGSSLMNSYTKSTSTSKSTSNQSETKKWGLPTSKMSDSCDKKDTLATLSQFVDGGSNMPASSSPSECISSTNDTTTCTAIHLGRDIDNSPTQTSEISANNAILTNGEYPTTTDTTHDSSNADDEEQLFNLETATSDQIADFAARLLERNALTNTKHTLPAEASEQDEQNEEYTLALNDLRAEIRQMKLERITLRDSIVDAKFAHSDERFNSRKQGWETVLKPINMQEENKGQSDSSIQTPSAGSPSINEVEIDNTTKLSSEATSTKAPATEHND